MAPITSYMSYLPIGYDFVKRVFQTVDGVVAFNKRSLFEVVLGNVAEEFADDLQGFFAILGGKVAHAALLRVHFGTARGRPGSHLRQSRSLPPWAREEHVADALGHDGEVGEGGEYTAPPAHGPRMPEI